MAVAAVADGVATRESNWHGRVIQHSGISGDCHWHQSKYMREGLSFHADTENKETAQDRFNDIADVQAGHGSHVAGMI